MSTMIMLSPFVCRALSRCSMSLVFADCSKATNQFLPFFFSGAILLYYQSVFNSYGTASFVSNEAENDGGAMRGKSKSPFDSYVSRSFAIIHARIY